MNQTTAITFAGKNICSQISTFERMLTIVQAQPTHGYVGVVAFQTRLFQDGLDVFDEVDRSGDGGWQLGNIHRLRERRRAGSSINPQRPAAVTREASLYIRRTLVLKFIDKWQEWSRTKLRRVRILSRNEVVPSENVGQLWHRVFPNSVANV